MAVTASKVTRFDQRGARKNRVARVSAKAAGRTKRDDDREAELDDETREEVDASSAKARPDNGTYLSMYFRDMALLDVLRPEEEFTAAREIEALEIMLWEAVLSHPPAVDRVLDAVQAVPDHRVTSESKTLRRTAGGGDAKAFVRAATRAARRLRADDVDHLFVEAALGVIDRMTL
ncbi:MAG TPA: hypothetical protein VLX92_16150, partial [Kofleriaceae bacterium]|nr:hypothetical protein [Kofleriaceae bacterium]